MNRSKWRDIIFVNTLIFLMIGSTTSSLVVFAQTTDCQEVPLSPYYTGSNEGWWLHQFEGEGYQEKLEGHEPCSNTNCGPACTAMVINYLKGKGITTKCEDSRIDPDYPVYCYARWLYCQANGHPDGFDNDDWSRPGAETSQIQYALLVEGIQSHTFTGYECENDGTGIKNVENAIDQGKLCICLVAPMYYREDVTKYFSHWTTVYGYDDNHVYLNDPGYRRPPSGQGFKASKSDLADALWLVNELSTIIVIDDDWPSFHHDERNSRHSSTSIPNAIVETESSPFLEVDYNFIAVDKISAPLIVEDKVIVAISGVSIWPHVKLLLDLIFGLPPTPPGPGDSASLVRFYCFNTESGEIEWTKSLEAKQVVFALGEGYINSDLKTLLIVGMIEGWVEEGVLALDIVDGEMEWHNDEFTVTPKSGLNINDDQILVGGMETTIGPLYEDHLYSLNIDDGSLNWKVKVPVQVSSYPAILGNKVFFVASHSSWNYLYSVDMNTHVLSDELLSTGISLSDPAVYNNRLYIVEESIYLHSLNENGEELSPFPIYDDFVGSPSFAEGKILVRISSLISGEKLRCLDATSGDLIWDFDSSPGHSFTSPITSNDRAILYEKRSNIVQHFDKMYALRVSDKDVIWEKDVVGYELLSPWHIGEAPRTAHGNIFLSFYYLLLPAITAIRIDNFEQQDFLINVQSVKTSYVQGEKTETKVTVTNLRNDRTSFVLGVSFRDPNGDSEEYDPQITVVPEAAELDPEEATIFRVEWTIPLDAPPGIYDIAVNCWKDDTYTQKYTDNILWQSIFNVGVNTDVVLVIDRSGSMRYPSSKINGAKTSAKLFTDLMQIEDRIGVVSYSSYATANYRLSEIMSAATKTAAKNAIDKIYASGMTAMGRGLRTALNQLASYGDSSHPWAIVLMSNGWHNTGEHPYSVIPDLKSRNIKVYTIGLGAGADGNLLGYIASQTGGFYRYAATPEQLAGIYNDIAATVTQAQTVTSQQDSVAQDETIQSSVVLDPTITQATFTISWGGSDLDLTLISPDSTLIDPTVASTNPNIDYVEEPQYEFYRVENPVSGNWLMTITGVDVPLGTEDFVAKVTAITGITMTLDTDKDTYTYPEPVEIMATLQGGGIPVGVASIQATIIRPDASEVNLVLYDDGSTTHQDALANDGVFTNLFNEFNEDGSYTIKVKAFGLTTSGDGFSREDQKTVLVYGVPADATPPKTTLHISTPEFVDAFGNVYITSDTSIVLTAIDNNGAGSGVADTHYKIYNATYDTGWTVAAPPIIFQITGADDGAYSIDYYSTDNAGNVETTNIQIVVLDNTPPLLTVETPSEGDALQDGVTFRVSAWDLSAVDSVTISIQCAQGNVISPEFESMPAILSPDGKWELYFDTTQLPDGFYMFVANGTDVLGNTGTTTVQFSIRNWACLELLPASESNKGGRTMPVKFSLRVIEAVDPAQPFVYNEELTIIIYEKGHSENILQESTFGTTARDYRIDTESELYITNFKTMKKPTTYVVEIWRKGMLIGTFEFSTVK